MSHVNQADLPKRRLLRLLPCLLGGLVFSAMAGAGQVPAAAASAQGQYSDPAPAAYRVINLGSGSLGGFSAFNARGQIAISLADENNVTRAWFYDGKSLRDIGTLGGSQSFAYGLNDVGEVAGYSYLAGDATYHAFKWSQRSGMRDLGTLAGMGGSAFSVSGQYQPINHRGQVAGASSTQGGAILPCLWTPGEGMRDLGALPGGEAGYSIAQAINDAGMVAGQIAGAGGVQPFVWSRRWGLVELGNLGGSFGGAAGITEDGMVVGNTRTADEQNRIFVWTRSGGLRDIGTAGGLEAYTSVQPLSSNGYVAANIRFNASTDHAALWTRTRGLVDLGTLGAGGTGSNSGGVNNRGQVAGIAYLASGDTAGFIWTAREGMIDLNTRRGCESMRRMPFPTVD